MSNAIGIIELTLNAGSVYNFAASCPFAGGVAADSFIARTTATLTYWSTGATPNGSHGLWVNPGDVWDFEGDPRKVQICAQGAGYAPFEFYEGGL